MRVRAAATLHLALTCGSVLLALCLLCTPHARADGQRVVPEARIESARGIALGTGSRASATGTQAQTDNPANLPLAGVYHIEGFTTFSPTFKRFGSGVNVVDSMTSKLAAGMSARWMYGDNRSGENSGWEGRIGLGLPIIEMLSIGAAGRYANFTNSDTHAIAEHRAPPGVPWDRTFKVKGFTVDAAATLRPMDGLAISALAYNIIDLHSPLAPRLVGGSVAFGSQSGVSIGADVLVDLNQQKLFDGKKLTFGGGLEYLASGLAPIRVGYAYDQGRKQHSLTGGFGYVSQTFGAQLSMRQTVSNGSETLLISSVQYFVH
jgi:hypothetical protein